jgi:hypothetical protein
MTTIIIADLPEILERHQKWLDGKEGGRRADLSRAKLTGAILAHADLGGADLTGARLDYADLTAARLDGAKLTDADLDGANLTGARLDYADLDGADLTGARLDGADLTGARLTDADLDGADLTDADLDGADLTGARLDGAKLTGAKLTGAKLTGAKLTGADLDYARLTDADLDGAILTDAIFTPAPAIPNIDARILEAISAEGANLEMDFWHDCETTHCRAGWAIVLAGEEGKALEARIGPWAAGAAIYAASRLGVTVPNFYASNEEALADLRECAARNPSTGVTQ